MIPLLLFLGGLVFLGLFVWYLAAVEPRSRLRAGFALWLVAIAVSLLSVYPPKETIRLGLDLKGGTSFTIELQGDVQPSALQEAVGVIRKRVDKFGVSEPIIQPSGDRRILVQIPGLSVKDKASARAQLEKVAKLEFRMVHPDSAIELDKVAQGQPLPLGYEKLNILETRSGKPYSEPILVKRRIEMGGQMVNRAFRFVGPTGESGVSLEFSGEGRDTFGKLTEANVGQRLAIVLDGEVRSAPVIRQAIVGGTAEITGSFTPQEAEELASVLENPLETPVKIIEERAVDPSLGRDSIRSGLIAGAIGSLAVVVFMAWYYRLAGVVAVGALAVNLCILFGLMAQFHFSLTLPGIAGIVLTVGMAVDANVLIYERIREELAAGKTITGALSGGFNKAFSSILDANLTTIITSVILFWQGAGPVQGFAVTLTLGIVGTLFAALIVTRNILEWLDAKQKIKKMEFVQFIKSPRIDFMKYRWGATTASLVVVLVSMAGFLSKGDAAYGVDFTGGDALTVQAKQFPDIATMRSALAGSGMQEAILQLQRTPDGKTESLFIRAKFGEGDRAEEILRNQFPQAGLERVSLDKVGAVVGTELKWKSLTALALGMLGILIYVTWRFEFSFAVGAILALLHDVVITVGVMSLMGREMSLPIIGAILTIAGYSINDTIVVFDRIRETLRAGTKGSLYDLFNGALNQTLSRTLLTSMTTLLSVIALYLFGGQVINDFALALLIGISVGTYSSIYIASPIVFWWTGGRSEYLRKQVVRKDTPSVIPGEA
jgi:SecD/SecF fusion protein